MGRDILYGANPFPGNDPNAADWFDAKLYTTDGGTPEGFTFKEWNLDDTKALVRRAGGRENTSTDLAYFIDPSVAWTIDDPLTDPPVLVRRAAGAGGTKWEIVKMGGGSQPPAICSSGCGWFAGATEYDCWTLSVVGAGGNMASLDLTQELSFSWVADALYPDGGYWVSDDDFTVCDCVGLIRLWRDAEGEPQLELMDCGYVLSLSCCDTPSQTLYFSGGNSGTDVLCCARQIEGGPAENLFTVAVTYTRCPPTPNPDYTTPGWYCVAVTSCSGSRQCCYLTTDPGITVVLCSGPHADEADCTALCTPPDTVTITCGAVTVTVPRTLFVFFGNGTATTMTYVSSFVGWQSPDFVYNGHSIYVTMNFGCVEETGVITWGIGVGSHSDTCTEGTINAASSAYSPFVAFFTGLQPTLSCGTPGYDTVIVQE